jgi:hypothetical protein
LKVSLLRDNPTNQDIAAWEQVISERNPILAAQIRSQLQQRGSESPEADKHANEGIRVMQNPHLEQRSQGIEGSPML